MGFAGCGFKTITIPNNVKYIEDAAFYGCENLESVQFSNGLERIGMQCFRECKKLTQLIFPDGLKDIGYQCCIDCSSLTFIQLPSTLELIDNFTFENCTNLNTIIALNETPVSCRDPFRGVSKVNCKLFVPDESVQLYREAEYWNAFLDILGISEYSGIDEVVSDTALYPLFYVNSSGYVSTKPNKGFNIVVYSNGATKKAVF